MGVSQLPDGTCPDNGALSLFTHRSTRPHDECHNEEEDEIGGGDEEGQFRNFKP